MEINKENKQRNQCKKSNNKELIKTIKKPNCKAIKTNEEQK